jgi:hypothetical protein
MSDHARLSPSKLKYLELCPHYCSSDGPNAAADEGTLIHDALERDDLSQLNDEQKTLALMCQKFVNNTIKRGDTVIKEMKLPVLELAPGDWVWGTADLVILRVETRHAVIIDYKMGRTEVDDADSNFQGQAYALGLITGFPELDTVEVIFLLPRQDLITSHTYGREDMEDITLRILRVNALSHDPDAPYNPTAAGCQWCAGKGECPELRRTAMVVARNSGVLTLPDHFNPGTMVNIEDRNRAQLLAPILEDWCKQVKANNLQACLDGGLELPDFSLVARSGARRVVDTAVVFETLNQLGVTPVQFMLYCSINIGDLDGMLRQIAKDKGEPIAEFLSNVMLELERLAAVEHGQPTYYLRRKTQKKQKA